MTTWYNLCLWQIPTQNNHGEHQQTCTQLNRTRWTHVLPERNTNRKSIIWTDLCWDKSVILTKLSSWDAQEFVILKTDRVAREEHLIKIPFPFQRDNVSDYAQVMNTYECISVYPQMRVTSKGLKGREWNQW